MCTPPKVGYPALHAPPLWTLPPITRKENVPMNWPSTSTRLTGRAGFFGTITLIATLLASNSPATILACGGASSPLPFPP